MALVTGGARGIGRAIVEASAERGAQIIVADIDEERAVDIAVQIGQQSFSVRLDAGAIGTIEGTVHEAAERTGRIDILVNNAAIFDMAPPLDVTPQSFERLFQVNVEGVFFVLQAVARLMVRVWPRRLHHQHGIAGRPAWRSCFGHLRCDQARVISLTQSAALALIKDRIRVNAIAPGVIDTEMWDRVDALYARQFGLPPGEKKREQGCDLNSRPSINQFLQGNRPRQNPNTIRKTESVETGGESVDGAIPDLNQIELGPVGKRVAAAALMRLEEIEERAHARLMRAIEAGNPFQVKAAQVLSEIE